MIGLAETLGVEQTPASQPFDWPLRWLVPSRSTQDEPHIVDLGAFRGNGACSCRHFECALQPSVRRLRSPGDQYRCFHIQEARVNLGQATKSYPRLLTDHCTRADQVRIEHAISNSASLLEMSDMVVGAVSAFRGDMDHDGT